MKVVVLTDVPAFVAPLASALSGLGAHPEVVDVRTLVVTPSSVRRLVERADCVVNRLSAAAGGEEGALVVKAREVMEMVSAIAPAAGTTVVNGARCQRIASSKVLQAAAVERVWGEQREVATVASYSAQDRAGAWAEASARGAPLLLKPNVGAYGRGVVPAEAEDASTDSLDGVVLYQTSVAPDRLAQPPEVHRAEIVDGAVLYVASTPFAGVGAAEGGGTNFCVKARAAETRLQRRPAWLADADVERLASLSRLSGMQIGAVEFFRLADGTLCVFDINPVSSPHPDAARLLGADPHEAHARLVLEAAALDKGRRQG